MLVATVPVTMTMTVAMVVVVHGLAVLLLVYAHGTQYGRHHFRPEFLLSNRSVGKQRPSERLREAAAALSARAMYLDSTSERSKGEERKGEKANFTSNGDPRLRLPLPDR